MPVQIFLLLLRLPILISLLLTYFAVLQWMAIGSFVRKASLWLILGLAGVWWIDLQIDGVKKGYTSAQADDFLSLIGRVHSSLAKHHRARLPQPSSIIASSFTSPIDAIYLAAIFDPVFTASYPATRLVQQVSLFQAVLGAFLYPQSTPTPNTELVDLQTLIKRFPNRAIVVFPECSTTNGRGILPFSPSILTAPPSTKIFPISLRYTPADITTPVPQTYLTFFWNLLTKPTHCIRVRIAASVSIGAYSPKHKGPYPQGYLGAPQDDTASSTDTLLGSEEGEGMGVDEKKVLDVVAEALARMGRVKRVGLSLEDKASFIKAWIRRRR